MNLLKKGLRIESTIRIFKVQIHESRFTSPPAWIDKDWFCVIVLRIRQDLWGFVGFMKKGRIFWKSVYESNSGTKSFETLRFVIYYMKWIRIHIVRHESNLFEVRICGHNTVQIHGFAKRIHVFMNLLYDSRILAKTLLFIGQVGHEDLKHMLKDLSWKIYLSRGDTMFIDLSNLVALVSYIRPSPKLQMSLYRSPCVLVHGTVI